VQHCNTGACRLQARACPQSKAVPKSKKVMPPLGTVYRLPWRILVHSTPQGPWSVQLGLRGLPDVIPFGAVCIDGSGFTGCHSHPVYVLQWSEPLTLTPFELPLPSTRTYAATWWGYVYVIGGFACRDGHVSMYVSMRMTPPHRGSAGTGASDLTCDTGVHSRPCMSQRGV
jgi:hypothetical protein